MTETYPQGSQGPLPPPEPPVGRDELMARVVKVGTTKWHTIGMTSPYTQGHGTAEAQFLLTKDGNRFDEDFDPGKIDGVYGPQTGRATLRAKYWLGYRQRGSKWNTSFGGELRSYLLKPTSTVSVHRLPVAYRLRRAWRLRAATRARRSPLPIRALAEAETFIGYQGTGEGGVCSKFGQWYGFGCAPWCAMFATYCITKVGGKFHQSFVPDIVNLAELREGGLRIVETPEPGVLVCYDWTSDGIWDHVEFFKEWLEPGVSFHAVGGNTGEVGGVPGGQVLDSLRYTSVRHCFVAYSNPD